MAARQLSNTKSALEMAKFGGTYKDDNANGGNTMANAKEWYTNDNEWPIVNIIDDNENGGNKK